MPPQRSLGKSQAFTKSNSTVFLLLILFPKKTSLLDPLPLPLARRMRETIPREPAVSHRPVVKVVIFNELDENRLAAMNGTMDAMLEIPDELGRLSSEIMVGSQTSFVFGQLGVPELGRPPSSVSLRRVVQGFSSNTLILQSLLHTVEFHQATLEQEILERIREPHQRILPPRSVLRAIQVPLKTWAESPLVSHLAFLPVFPLAYHHPKLLLIERR